LGNGKIYAWRREKGKQTETASIALPANTATIQLRIKAQMGEIFNFAYSLDGKIWEAVGDKVSFGNLEGARIALLYSGKTAIAGARFDWIRVENN
jgi:hypothetical protein